jgi:hypothetical protein
MTEFDDTVEADEAAEANEATVRHEVPRVTGVQAAVLS